MSTYGVQSTGFVVKPLSAILADLKTRLEAVTDADGNTLSIDLEDSTIVSQMTNIFGEVLSECWSAAGALSQQFDPRYNTGAFQSGTVQLNGITRNWGTPTQIQIRAYGNEGTIILAGSKVAYGSDTFEVDDPITVGAAGTASGTVTAGSNPTDEKTINIGGITYLFQSSTPSVPFEVKRDSTAELTMEALTKAINGTGIAGTDYGPGTFANPYVSATRVGAVVTVTARSSGTPGNLIVIASADAGVTMSGTNLTGGTDNGSVIGTATCTGTEPVVVPDNAALNINDTTSGWLSCICLDTLVDGVAVESDTSLRVRQQLMTQFTAQRESEAIEAAVRAVDSVTYAKLYENPTETTDSNGIPAGTIEVVVVADTDSDTRTAVCNAIYGVMACMTKTAGDSATANTINGTVIKYKEPSQTAMLVRVTYKIRTGESTPADASDQIKAALLAFVNDKYTPSQSVYADDLYGAFDDLVWADITGVSLGATTAIPAVAVVTIGTNPADGDTVTINGKAYRFKSSMIAVNDVKLDSTAALTASHLAKTINGTGVAGTDFYTGTTPPTDVTAMPYSSGTSVTCVAVTGGVGGNAYALSTSVPAKITVPSTFTGGSTKGAESQAIAFDSVATFSSGNITVANE